MSSRGYFISWQLTKCEAILLGVVKKWKPPNRFINWQIPTEESKLASLGNKVVHFTLYLKAHYEAK